MDSVDKLHFDYNSFSQEIIRFSALLVMNEIIEKYQQQRKVTDNLFIFYFLNYYLF